MSAPRFNTFLAAAGGDRDKALKLYEWNAAMSAAVLHDLAHLEVGIRNAYDSALVARQPSAAHWTQDAVRYFPVRINVARDGTSVDSNEAPRKQLLTAINQAGGAGAPTGKVVAELMFGFWRYLTISARETDLWLPYLRFGFVRGTTRRHIDSPMKRLHTLRNRVAHHEPLLIIDLNGRRNDLLGVLSRISPDLRTHVEAQSTWSSVQAQRPK